jgi:hypothetical protein
MNGLEDSRRDPMLIDFSRGDSFLIGNYFQSHPDDIWMQSVPNLDPWVPRVLNRYKIEYHMIRYLVFAFVRNEFEIARKLICGGASLVYKGEQWTFHHILISDPVYLLGLLPDEAVLDPWLSLLIDAGMTISSVRVEWIIRHLPRLVWRGDPNEDRARGECKDSSQSIDYKLRPSRPGVPDRCSRFRERLLMFGFPMHPNVWDLVSFDHNRSYQYGIEFPYVSLTTLDKYGHRQDKLEFLFRAVALGLLDPPATLWLPMYDEIHDPLWKAFSDCTNAGRTLQKELCALLPKVLISIVCSFLQR